MTRGILIAYFLLHGLSSLLQGQSYFIQLEDIIGNSTTKGFEEWIPVDSFHISFARPFDPATGTIRRRAQVVPSDFVVTAPISKASPPILQALLAGRVFPELVFHEVDTFGSSGLETYAIWEFSNAFVTEFEQTSPSNERYAFAYEQLNYTHIEFDETGGKTSETEVTWDFRSSSPLEPVDPFVLADIDLDQELNATDLDLLTMAIRSGSTGTRFDLNFDGMVDFDDRTYWIIDLYRTLPGDANLNRSVDFADFLMLSASFGEPAGWSNGDFDGNGTVGFADFLELSANFGSSVAAAEMMSDRNVAAVPEPTCAVGWVLLLGLGLALGKRRSR